MDQTTEQQGELSKVESFAEFVGDVSNPTIQPSTPSQTAPTPDSPVASVTATGTATEPVPTPQSSDQSKAVEKSPIHADESGVLMPRTLEDQYRYAVAVCRSGLVPATFNTPEKVLVGMQFAAELGLKPITALRQIYVVNGSPSLWGDLPLALVRRSGLLEVFEEFFLDEKGKRIPDDDPMTKVFGASCIVKRIGRNQIKKSFTKADAEQAGVWGKKVWGVYPKRMLQLRARSWALKDEFGDILQGVAIAEYDYDMIPGTDSGGMSVERPRGSAAALNQRFASKKDEPIEVQATEKKTT